MSKRIGTCRDFYVIFGSVFPKIYKSPENFKAVNLTFKSQFKSGYFQKIRFDKSSEQIKSSNLKPQMVFFFLTIILLIPRFS